MRNPSFRLILHETRLNVGRLPSLLYNNQISMNKPILLFTLYALCAGAWQQSSLKLPPPFATPSSANPPKVVSRPDGAQLKLPKGFTIEPYATGFERPRFMAQGASGEILLSDFVPN